MNLFFDNNISPRLARAVKGFIKDDRSGVDAYHLRDLFRQNVTDVEWLKGLDPELKWIIFTADLRITKNRHEFQAWQESGHPTFFMMKGWANLNPYEYVSKFFHHLPHILKTANKAKPRSGFQVQVKGLKYESL